VVQWRRSLGAAERSNLTRFFQHEQLSDSEFAEHFVDLALSSRAQLVVIPLQDFLALGAEARMNRPATESGNWVWRASESHLSAARAGLIRQKLTKAHRLGDQQAKAP
jgi:4-alpha-glucanotransferase